MENDTSRKERQMLSSRLINSVPVVRTFWGYGVDSYNYAKDTALFKPSIDAAEAIAQPLVQRYKNVDDFASNAYDKTKAAIPSPTDVLSAAAYPVGYAYGLTLGTMNAVENTIQGTVLQRPVEKVYDMVDAVIDGIMPAQKRELADEEETSLRRKNPVRRLQKRASLQSIRALPSNSIKFGVRTTKKYTRMAAARSVDYALSFVLGRVDRNVQRATRVANFLMQISFISNIVEIATRPVYQFGGPLLSQLAHLALSQIDLVHGLISEDLPHTAVLVEKLSLAIYTQFAILSDLNRKSLSVFEDEDRLREPRTRMIKPAENSRVENVARPSAEKKVEEPARAASETIKSSEAIKSSEPIKSSDTEVKNIEQAVKVAPENPYAALLVDTEMDHVPADIAPITSHHAKISHKQETVTEQEPEQETKENDNGFAARIALRAQEELQKWKEQERHEKEERERHLRERHIRERELQKEQEQKLQEDKVRKAAARRVELAEEKAKAEQEAKEVQERRENELLDKEIAHFKARQEYLHEKEIRDEKLKEKHMQEAYLKKKAEVERAVKAALKQREEEWRAEHADEIKAKEIGKELVEEVKKEKAKEEIAAAKEERKAEAAKAKSQTHEAPAKEETPAKEATKEKKKPEAKHTEQEIVVIGGTKVVDEATHWTVHTNNDEKWQTVSKGKGGHISRANEAALHPKPIKDADNTPLEKNNEFLSLTNSQGTATI